MKNKTLTFKQYNDAILEARTTAYMKKAIKGLFWTFLFVSILEVFFCIFIKYGFFSFFLEFQNGLSIVPDLYISQVSVMLFLTWTLYFLYRIFFKKMSHKTAKVLFTALLLVITTIECFGHWKINYLSILYCMPVVMTSPLGKKSHKTTLIISLFCVFLYYIFQFLLCFTNDDTLNFSITLFVLSTLYYISRIIYRSMVNDIEELEKYTRMTTKLNEQLSKDMVTGAYSKKTLLKDVSNFNEEYKSMALIDLDDFKELNKTYGHSVGDNILENLVERFEGKEMKIYRYDKDIFVLFSKDEKEVLAEKIEEIKFSFIHTSLIFWSCKVSFSAGVISLNEEDKDISVLINKCSAVVKIAKSNGKNKISIGDESKK